MKEQKHVFKGTTSYGMRFIDGSGRLGPVVIRCTCDKYGCSVSLSDDDRVLLQADGREVLDLITDTISESTEGIS